MIRAAPDLLAALRPLAAIADRYDANGLDGEGRKFWGRNHEHENVKPPDKIVLFCGRGGKELLTLADCLAARAAIARAEGRALRQQTVPTLTERLAQSVERSGADRHRGHAEGYAAAAGLARHRGLAEYLGDADANDDLREEAANRVDDEARGCPRSWHTGYLAGLADFRSDLAGYEYDEAAEARLVAAGVDL